MAENKIKLLSCPFCGGKAIITDMFYNSVAVVCKSCRASGGEFPISKDYCANEKAAEAWNLRIKND